MLGKLFFAVITVAVRLAYCGTSHEYLRCALHRSHLLEISYNATLENVQLRQHVGALHGRLEEVSKEHIALARDHSSLLQEQVEALQDQRTTLERLLQEKDQHASTKQQLTSVINKKYKIKK